MGPVFKNVRKHVFEHRTHRKNPILSRRFNVYNDCSTGEN
jgi:hypothetical protein